MYLLADRINQDRSTLDDLANRFDAGLSIITTADSDLNSYQLERLKKHRPIVETTNQGRTIRISYLLNEQELLEAKIDNLTEQQAQATIYLLLEDWQRSREPIKQFIERSQVHFGIPLSTVSPQELKLTDIERARMQYGEALVRLSVEDREAEALLRLPGERQLLKMGPIKAFDSYSWSTIVIIATIAILLLGLGIYWVVSSFEVRLHKLERATSRLSQGHLSARVAINGEDPVARLGRAFNKMAEHIQRLISIQREMVRAVSHDLRTPVARIRFGLQIIEDSSDDPYIQKQLAGIDTDIQELDGLIDEILTYARLEEGGPILDFQRENVAEIARRVVHEARVPEHISVVYVGEDPSQCMPAEIEPRYIHRAIQNLVGNAARYAKSQVRVVCSVGTKTCRVDVEDDGPGIPKEQWEKVFTAFARLDDSRTRNSGGYGLGLSIVRRIAFWHGGHANVCHSEQLGGARFSLVWPRRHQDT